MIEGRSRVPNDDIYGLGCVAYSLHTGEHPFNRMSSLDAQVEQLAPRKPFRIRPAEWEAVRAALAFPAEQRPSDAAVFRDIYFRRSFFQRLFSQ
jgi:serine/threonine-protein kinase Stk1